MTIKAIVTFEVAGKPRSHVEETLDRYVKNINQDERITIDHEDREEAVEHEDGMWSTFSECEMSLKNLEVLTWLCINFSPASVEILEPDELKVESQELTHWFNDLLAKLHDVSANYRNQQGANENLVIAMNQLIQNAVLLSLKRNKKTEKQLMEETGISDAQLGPFLEHMLKKQQIKRDGDVYSV